MQGDPTHDAAEDPHRGSGSTSAPATNTRDVRLLALALEERWPMSPEAREAAVARLEAVVLDRSSKGRAFDRALRALTSLGRLNLAAVDVAMKARAQEELEERVAAVEEHIKQQGDQL
jgi:hypothetical protein